MILYKKFEIRKKKKLIETSETYLKPFLKDNNKIGYEEVYKKKEIETFLELNFEGNLLIEDYPNLIRFTEILKFWASNRLDTSYIYNFFRFSLKSVRHKGQMYLALSYELDKNNALVYLDKLDCSILAAQISKYCKNCIFE